MVRHQHIENSVWVKIGWIPRIFRHFSVLRYFIFDLFICQHTFRSANNCWNFFEFTWILMIFRLFRWGRLGKNGFIRKTDKKCDLTWVKIAFTKKTHTKIFMRLVPCFACSFEHLAGRLCIVSINFSFSTMKNTFLGKRCAKRLLYQNSKEKMEW